MSSKVHYSRDKKSGWRLQCGSSYRPLYWDPDWKIREITHECGKCGTELEPPIYEEYDANIPSFHVGPIVELKDSIEDKCGACGETWTSMSKLFGREMNRIGPKILELFDKNSTFFDYIEKKR